MRPPIFILALLALPAVAAEPLTVASPDGRLRVSLTADARGLSWSLARDGRRLVEPSPLGVVFAESSPKDEGTGAWAALKVEAVRRASRDETWTTRLSRRETFRDRCNEMSVSLVEAEPRAVCLAMGETAPVRRARRLAVVFRVSDDGAAFRYEFPEQAAFDGFELREELTEWRFAADAKTWTEELASRSVCGEFRYAHLPVAALPADYVTAGPLLVETAGATLALSEAALFNWAGVEYGALGGGAAGFRARLAPLPESPAATKDVAVIATTPAKSPWRVVLVGDDELDLLKRGDFIANLNPGPDPAIDFSFVKPGVSSWDWWSESNNSLSTERTLQFVDFAAEMGWRYHTIDGGWYGFARRPNHGPNVAMKPRRGFDLPRILAHAKARGVGIWLWIHWQALDDWGLEETFAQLEKWGVAGVKLDFLNRQDQWMVGWCERVCRVAARHRVMLNFHGSFKSTGGERTWPNMITREAVLGNEVNIFDRHISPAHVATLPFTRFLVGPADFTPGSFANVYSKDFVPQVEKGHRYADPTDRCPHWAEEQGTRAHALALCVQFDSPLLTLCDAPERYRGAAGVELLKDLPATWKATSPRAGRCGAFYDVVRESHDGRFYFAATTVKARTATLDLGFLGDGDWQMRVYADDPSRTPSDAKAIRVETRVVRRGETVAFPLGDEGGAVAVFKRL